MKVIKQKTYGGFIFNTASRQLAREVNIADYIFAQCSSSSNDWTQMLDLHPGTYYRVLLFKQDLSCAVVTFDSGQKEVWINMEINGVGLECDTWAQRLCLFSVCLRNVTKCVCTDKNDKSLGNPPILYLWDLRVSAGSFYHCFSQICQAMHAPSTFLMELTHPLYLSRAFIEIKQTNKQALLWPLYLFRSLPHNFSNAPLSIPCHTWLNSPPPHKPFSKKNIYFIFFQATLSVGSWNTFALCLHQ